MKKLTCMFQRRINCVPVLHLLVLIFAKVKCYGDNTNHINSSEYGNTSIHCLGRDCALNSTKYVHEEVPVPTKSPSPDPPFWCPEGYNLLNKNGNWFQLCRLQPCVHLNREYNFTAESLTNDTTITTNRTLSTVTLCQKSFANQFEMCPKLLLDESQYEITTNDGSVWNLVGNYSVPLGEYYIQLNRAIICDKRTEALVEPLNRVELPIWCMPIVVSNGDSQIENSTELYVESAKIAVKQNYFKIDENNNSVVHACAKMDPTFVSCKRRLAVLESHLFTLMPNLEVQLHENMLSAHDFPVGHYILAEDKSMLLYCPEIKEPTLKETLYTYGAVALLSAFCLLLALVAHMFFPSLNYHTKSLLCLAFSLFIMYIAIAIRNFSDNAQRGAGNVVLFAVQYIFALGAFFWLNVLAFDLWKVFANLKGTITPGANKAKKRLFLAKCAYAWGVPVLLCVTVIGISYSPKIQRALYVDFNFENISWFTETTSCLIFFYVPIIIILVENLIFFILTIINIRIASSGTDILNKKVSRKLFKVYAKLFLVMGIFWIAEVIAWFAKDLTQEHVWYFTDILNSLQGVFIFIVYVCKKKTLLIMKKKFGYINDSAATQSTSTSQAKDRSRPIALANIHKRDEGL